MNVSSVQLTEVGPREGFQFEGIGAPDKISTEQKVNFVNALVSTGVKRIEVTSFVSPKAVPQMADAEEVSRRLPEPPSGLSYTAIYLNDKGLARALATERYLIEGAINFTASETFSLKNQNRSHEQDIDMQRRQMAMFGDRGILVNRGEIMAAFGCNYEGDVPVERVVDLVAGLQDLVSEVGSTLSVLQLADTMGWADPEMIKERVYAVRNRWPDLSINLHLHDTRGTGVANVYAALDEGVTSFDTAVGGLGGCPFAGTPSGNVCTEDVVFMCERMGINTGVDLERMIECARLAEEIVGHPLPSKMVRVGTRKVAA